MKILYWFFLTLLSGKTNVYQGVVLCAPDKREIHSDGGYPKFPPDDDDNIGFIRKISTKDIRIDDRIKREESGGGSGFMELMEKFGSYMSSFASSYGGDSDSDNLEESEEDLYRRVTRQDAAAASEFYNQMPEDVQKWWVTAMEYYEKFKKEQAELEQHQELISGMSSSGGQTSGTEEQTAATGEKKYIDNIL